ncbi:MULTISPECIES: hypothetical protein [Kosakonia]|uniref:Uncharacterized protein n=1 Tax=Kosakonia oryziphila TaxID=1005667 RepID=A0A1C4G0D2_9ENTR|nr:hypothetical protein [Kosakonia oryziphila]SCC61592.1 hypothetical protein GA0061070_10486 [Kosakonia oryziphila]
MTVNSTGSQNRNAGRDFNENNIQIERVDAQRTINIAIPSTREDDRPLVKAQRKELNKLVMSIAEAGEGEAYEIWQRMHAEIGVSSIDEMTVNQYQTAVSFLQAILDRCKDGDARKALVHLLLRNSEEGDSRQRLIRFCHINFGTGRFNDLTRPQLQMALSWLDEENQTKPANESTKNHSDIASWLKDYPKEIIVVFIVGVVVGALFF